MLAQSNPPPASATDSNSNNSKRAVRDWAVLLGGTSLGLLVLITGGVALILARRRSRLRDMKIDTEQRRRAERDAWVEAGRRASTPSAEELEQPKPGDAGGGNPGNDRGASGPEGKQ